MPPTSRRRQSGLGSTGRYEFGPVEVERDGEWQSVGGTGGSVSVVGVGT
jgi:hypothetical protein